MLPFRAIFLNKLTMICRPLLSIVFAESSKMKNKVSQKSHDFWDTNQLTYLRLNQ